MDKKIDPNEGTTAPSPLRSSPKKIPSLGGVAAGAAGVGPPSDSAHPEGLMALSPSAPSEKGIRRHMLSHVRSGNPAAFHTPVWVLPAFTWLFVLMAVPLAFIFILSLARRNPAGGIDWVLGVSNYVRAMDPLYLWIYWRSLLLALATTLICLLLAFPVAHFIAQQPSAGSRNLLLFLVTLPFWTSFLIRTYAWILLLRTEGIINNALVALGIIQQPLPLLYNNFAILAGLAYAELPFMILPLYTALERIDKSQIEASSDLGCTAWQTFWRVLVPLSRHGIIAGVVLVFVPSVGAYLTPDLLGGAKSIMAGNLIHNQFAVVRDHPFGAAIAFVLTVVVLALLGISYRTTREHAERRVL